MACGQRPAGGWGLQVARRSLVGAGAGRAMACGTVRPLRCGRAVRHARGKEGKERVAGDGWCSAWTHIAAAARAFLGEPCLLARLPAGSAGMGDCPRTRQAAVVLPAPAGAAAGVSAVVGARWGRPAGQATAQWWGPEGGALEGRQQWRVGRQLAIVQATVQSSPRRGASGVLCRGSQCGRGGGAPGLLGAVTGAAARQGCRARVAGRRGGGRRLTPAGRNRGRPARGPAVHSCLPCGAGAPSGPPPPHWRLRPR